MTVQLHKYQMEHRALHWLGDRKYLDSAYQQTLDKPKGSPARSSTRMTYHIEQMLCARNEELHSPGKKHVVGKTITDLGLGRQVRDALSQSPPKEARV